MKQPPSSRSAVYEPQLLALWLRCNVNHGLNSHFEDGIVNLYLCFHCTITDQSISKSDQNHGEFRRFLKFIIITNFYL